MKSENDFTFLKADDIRADSYQRPTTPARVNKIAKLFDVDMFGFLTVGKRVDGSLYVVDGLTRLSALRKASYAPWVERGAQYAPCVVFESHGLEHEAHRFEALNGSENKRNATAYDSWRANVDKGEKYNHVAYQCGLVLDAVGIKVGRGRAVNQTSAVSRIQQMFKRSPDMLSDVLTFAKNTWRGEPEAFESVTLGALAIIYEERDHKFPEWMTKACKRYTAADFMADYKANASRTGNAGTKFAANLLTMKTAPSSKAIAA